MTDKLKDRLEERRKAGNFRSLISNTDLADFVSNDYLGLARNSSLFEKISSKFYDYPISKNGSTGSRLLAGNSLMAENLEDKLARIFQAEAAILFSSGYMANLAVISSLPQKGDTIIYDSLSHVCLKEGAWLSKAESISFRHNDLEDLEAKLSRATGDVYVVIESVYSMDGDYAPIKKIVSLSKKYNAQIIIDEAHSTGVMGKLGSGMVCDMGIQNEILARVYTFGKGMGVHGACVCGSRELIDYLINFGRSFIYTTALPPHSISSIDCAFDYLEENIQLQNELRSLIEHFNSQWQDHLAENTQISKFDSATAIQPILVPGNEKAKRLAKRLQEAGFDVRPILSPTVKTGTERLRISLHVHNTIAEIDKLINTLKVNTH